MRMTVVQLIAIITTALYLVPTGAHLFELPNKVALTPTEYLTVQKIYASWSLFGVVIGMALLATLARTLLARADRTSFAFRIVVGSVRRACRDSGPLLGVYLPGQCSDQILDRASRSVRGGTSAMGMLADQRCAHICGAQRDCPRSTFT